MRWKSIIPEQKDEYLGNMWGWKFSFFGLALLILMIGLMAYRYHQIEENGEQSKMEVISEK